MGIKRSKYTLLLLLIALSLAGCRKPSDNYLFTAIDPAEVATDYQFEFSADLSDSSKTYISEIVCRFDPQILTKDGLKLDVNLLSPSGREYYESVNFPFALGSEEIEILKISYKLYDISWPYRDDITVGDDAGIWTIRISPADKQELKGIYGMGFSIKEK